MNLKILSLLVLFFSGSAFATSAQCPKDSNGDRRAPVYEKLTSTKWELILCGAVDRDHGKDIFYEFSVYASKGKQFKKLPFFGSAIERYQVKESPNGITIQNTAFVDHVDYAIFNYEVQCTDTECTVGKRTCANEKIPSKKIDGTHELIQSYLTGPKKGTAIEEYEINQIFFAAAYGDAEAIQAIRKNPGFSLDGATAEDYSQYARMFGKIKKLNCQLH